jgi:sialate O-acetylesterase
MILRSITSVVLMLILPLAVNAQNIKLPGIFTDNMVLQRNSKIPVWGTADPGTNLVITLADANENVTADANGRWEVKMPSMEAGGPYVLIVQGKEKIEFKNVMIGEVWICSGQSNMAMSVADIGTAYDNKAEIASAIYPNIRLFTVDPMTAASPQSNLKGSGWKQCIPENVKSFSAVAYFYGMNLYKKLNVPIGLINTSYGGTDIEAWTSGKSLSSISAFTDILNSVKKYSENDQQFLKEYNTKREDWKSSSMNTDAVYNSGIYKNINADISDWKEIKVPGLWSTPDLTEFNGSVWYRTIIDVPEKLAGQELTLNIGPVDDIDVTWFNGEKIGSQELWDKPRHYTIPASAVKAGKNLLVIRCIDTGGPGGIWGEANQFYISSKDGSKIQLPATWLYKKTIPINEFPSKPLSFEDPNCPTVLFNAMVAPLIPYSIRGVIWYQGENNTYRALQYRTLFPLMINDWRTAWNKGDFPFYYVQLANYMSTSPVPAEDTWAELREAQLFTLSVDNTGMASAIDIGDSSDIHPKNKREVGRRLSLIALAKTYDQNIEYSGPVMKTFNREASQLRIFFDHSEGLRTNGGKLTGFAIAGSDKKFYWAEARIEGSSVIIWNDNVDKPVAVRYGWASNPECNLYNEAGLPASPFRSDNWEVLTKDYENK